MKSQKILISTLVLNNSKSGYYRVIRNLILTLDNSYNNISYTFIFIIQKSAIKLLEIDVGMIPNHIKIIETSDFKSKWIRGIFEQFFIPYIASKLKPSFIFMPATFGLFFPVIKTITFVHTNTSFSLSSELRGRGLIQQIVHNFLVSMTAITSKKLLFTSIQTYNEYIKFTGRFFPKLVIGNGIMVENENLPSFGIKELVICGDYVLSVSQIYRLKNFHQIIAAFKKYKQRFPLDNLRLIIVGAIQEVDYYEELLLSIDSSEDLIILHNLSSSDLTYLYKNSLFYISMSLFEGFSLTPAESLIQNRPVLLSDIPVHREIYSSYAFFADPGNVEDIACKFEFMRFNSSDIDLHMIENQFSQVSFNKRLMDHFID
ncbi:glycosyltransferase family 4 protein [Polynucleobacter paneuropaeus]|nr:glycosyltransferase family 4 protein [Polynucleobacter paneuropaeus]